MHARAFNAGSAPDEALRPQLVGYLVESDPAVIKCGRVLSLYLGPEDLLVNLDVTFRDDLAEGGVLMAIDRIEEEVMDAFPQANRVFVEPESLNLVYRQRRDRRLAYEAYALGEQVTCDVSNQNIILADAEPQ